MAEMLSCDSSKYQNSRNSGKERHKNRKRNSPRKKNTDDDSRKIRNSLSRDKNFEDRRSPHSSDDRRFDYRSNERMRSNPPHSQNHIKYEFSHEDEEYRSSRSRDKLFGSMFGVSQHASSSYDSSRYDRKVDEVRFVSYNNHSSSHAHDDDEHSSTLRQKIDYLSDQVEYLTKENERLQYNYYGSNQSKSESEVNLIFRNKELEKKFLPTLEELVSKLIREDIRLEELQTFLSSKETSIENKPPEGELFALDNSMSEPHENDYIPRYETSFSDVLQDQDAMEQSANKKGKGRRLKICFNCSEDHMIYECPYKIDHQKVALAKRAQPRHTQPISLGRYHVHGMKESEYKPGIISDGLREALSLQHDQIPLYIYRMRLLNYPPGWLEEAEVERSGIALYGTDAQNDVNNKKDESKFGNQVQYDPAKLVDFPGFNVPLPPQFVDEAEELCLPPLQERHLRSVVEQFMPKVEGFPKRKRKLSLTDGKQSKVQRVEVDMDIDNSFTDDLSFEFNPPLPEDDVPPPPPPPEDDIPPPPEDAPEAPPPPPPEDAPPDASLDDMQVISIDSDSDSGSNTPMSDSLMEALAPFNLKKSKLASTPSLEDLEELKKRLVLELENPDECSSEASTPNPSSSTNGDVFSGQDDNVSNSSFEALSRTESCENQSEGCSRQTSWTESANEDMLRQLSRTDSQRSLSKFMSLGTPSLSRHSSFSKLPKYENFSKDVTDHINYENLPNSTGTYQKMKKVIKKVKEKINAFMQ